MNQAQMTYDSEANAAYVYLHEGPVARTKPIDDVRLIDYAKDGAVVGVEFLDARSGIDLSDLPEKTAIEQVIRNSDFGLHVLE